MEIAEPPQELRIADALLVPIPDAFPEPTDDFVRAFANEQLNSRVNCMLPEGTWEVLWKTALSARTASSHILRHADRILVEGSSQWQLLDTKGGSLAVGALDPGGITLDTARGIFYSMTPSGYLAARNLADGSPAFYLAVDFGNAFFHPFLASRKSHLLASGIERQLVPNATSPLASNLQLMDLGDQLAVDKDRILTSFRTLKNLMRTSANIHAALNGDSFVLATDNLIYIADTQFVIRKIYAGYFSPIAMSLDERGNMYLLARSLHSAQVLMVATPEGELSCIREVSGSLPPGTPPPIVSFDHSIYVLQENWVQSFGQRGMPLWKEFAGGDIAGGVVTPDGTLVVAAGSIVSAFDREGKRTILRFFPGEALCSQPLLCSDGSIYVATEDSLYRLIARKE